MSFVPSSEGSFSFKYEYTSRVFLPFTRPFSNQTNLSFAENFVSTKSNISSWVPLKCCIHQEPKKCKVRYTWRKLQLSNVGIDSNHWCRYVPALEHRIDCKEKHKSWSPYHDMCHIAYWTGHSLLLSNLILKQHLLHRVHRPWTIPSWLHFPACLCLQGRRMRFYLASFDKE